MLCLRLYPPLSIAIDFWKKAYIGISVLAFSNSLKNSCEPASMPIYLL